MCLIFMDPGLRRDDGERINQRFLRWDVGRLEKWVEIVETLIHRCLIAFLVCVCIPVGVNAEQLYDKGDFSMSLPDGWVEMPTEVIAAFEKEMARMAPNAPAQHYDYGFQLDSAKNWFEYPYILVQVKSIGRIPESQIEKMDGYSVQEGIDKRKSDFSSVMSDIQIGKMYYDRASKIIWLRAESNVVGIGPISGLSGTLPTEKGYIQLSGYSLRNDFSTYEPVFRASALSVRPAGELAYKPRWSDSLPPAVSGIDWERVATSAGIGALVAGILGLIAGFRKKKQR